MFSYGRYAQQTFKCFLSCHLIFHIISFFGLCIDKWLELHQTKRKWSDSTRLTNLNRAPRRKDWRQDNALRIL